MNRNLSNQFSGALFALGAALCWSLGGILIKLIPWNAMAICGLRSIIAAVVTFFCCKDRKIRFTPTNIGGALCLCSTTFLYVFANKYTTAANAIVLQYTAPVWILLISAVVLRRRIHRTDLIGVGVIAVGIVLFFFDDLEGGALLGNLLALASGLTFGLNFLINSSPKATPLQAMLMGHVLGAVVGLPFVAVDVTWDVVPWGAILIMGVVQLGLAYILFSEASQKIPPLLGSLICCVEPVLNPIWVALAIHEVPGTWSFVGIVLVISGVILYYLLLHRRQKQE